MKTLVVFLAVILLCCVDDPSPEGACAKSCEERGGEFYAMDGEYCYCAWYDGGAD